MNAAFRFNVVGGGVNPSATPAIRAALEQIGVDVVEMALDYSVALWDVNGNVIDALLVLDAAQAAQAALGQMAATVAPLLAEPGEVRRSLVIAGELRPHHDGGTIVDSRPTRIAWHAVQSALLQAQELGIGITWCAAGQLTEHLMMLLRRDRRSVVARRQIDPLGDRIAWLAGIAGIGIESARAVVAHCGGDLLAALCALTDPAIPPPTGICEGRWRRTQHAAREWLGAPDCTAMTVATIDEIWRDRMRGCIIEEGSHGA